MQGLGSKCHWRCWPRIATLSVAFLAVAVLPLAQASSAGTLDRVRQAAKLTLGYRIAARPFSYRDDSGKAAGYSVELCQKVADQVKTELGLSALTVEWVPVTLAERFDAVQQGKVDLLCGADSDTLARRKDVAFSIPIFPSGIGAMLRADAPVALRDVLEEGKPPPNPVWRGSPARTILEKKTFSVVSGTTGEKWLAGRLNEFEIDATVTQAASYDAGIHLLLNRGADVFFGDRPILLDAAKRSFAGQDLIVLDRLFTYEPLALALARNDDDFRLIVDETLSRLFKSGEIRDLYATWFGKPGPATTIFFGLSALPE